MAWQELTLGAQELALNANGAMEWNAALQLAMGDPAWVDIMWDEGERKLGLRPVNAPAGLPISKEPKTGEYTIDSASILATEGISVAENYAAEPETWAQTDAGTGWEEGFGLNPIYYITLPE